MTFPVREKDPLAGLFERLNKAFDRAAALFFEAKGSAGKDLSEDAGTSEEALRLNEKGAAYGKAAAVLDKYGNSILRIAYSYLHNMSDAEDVLQETLLQYVKTDPSLENDAHEKAWLLTVASNISKNRIKYNKLRKTDELMEELVAEEREDLGFVWEAVKNLPEKYREVIHLFYQEGYSTKEIADILKRKEATVRSDLLRAREQLKKILKEAYDFE
ncbi:MAG: sigma-70 family RNA polymerase sigma factor [Butyrivibrio sp.]|nr:sigma-70 family RNA polymerase sigma factor [Butyrivibrio sp.]